MKLPADMDITVCKRDERWTISWSSSDGTSGNAGFFSDAAPELIVTLFGRIIESHDRNPQGGDVS